jgi:dCMP deaminase
MKEYKNWDDYLIGLADHVSAKSKDRSTKVGVVIVGEHNQIISTGFNGFPRKIDDDKDERHERPAKYSWTEHGERNAIYNAARHGIMLEGSSLYLNWTPWSVCPDCCRAIIQSGIAKVIGPNRQFSKNKDWNFDVTTEMFNEAGIIVKQI